MYVCMYVCIHAYIGVDGFVCFQNIYSYIVTVHAVEQWYFHLCSATVTLYRIPCLKTEHDNLPVLIQYTGTGRPFFVLSIDMLRHTGSQVCPF